MTIEELMNKAQEQNATFVYELDTDTRKKLHKMNDAVMGLLPWWMRPDYDTMYDNLDNSRVADISHELIHTYLREFGTLDPIV